MIKLEWIGVILWGIAGLSSLFKRGKVSKISFALTWLTLMMHLIARAIN